MAEPQWLFGRKTIEGGENDGSFIVTLATDDGETIEGQSCIMTWEDMQRLAEVLTK